MHQPSRLHQFLKKLLQFVIFFSMMCFLFLHPSRLHLFHTYMSYFSTFSSQLISFATDKNYIFLLCNGILVFIAKYSSHTIDTRLPLLPETSPDDDLTIKAYQQSIQPSTEKTVVVEEVATNNKYENRVQANAVIAEDTVEEKYVVYQITNGVVKEEDVINDDEDAEYIKKKSENWFHEELQEEEEVDEREDEEEEQEEEEAISKMSTEELNRKFDDFIRKMKEDLRIEAQQQLIVV